MANDYVQTKIQDALKQANGNEVQARNTLIEWALQDQMLLIALTQNHLPSIASHAINQATTKSKPTIEKAAKNKEPEAKPKPVDVPAESFGKDLLQALSGKDTVRFGMESAKGQPIVTKRKKASQQHIDALKKMSIYPTNDQKTSK